MSHIGGTISASATITKWLEGYAATSAQANSDSANRPSLLQVLGDTDFGIKAFGMIGNVFAAGGEMELWLINGTGSVGLDGSGTSAKFRGLATADLRGMESHVPLRFSLNATYSLDNSGQVLQPTEAPVNQGGRGTSVTRIERFGLDVNRVDHFDTNIGAEYFAVDERIRPFIEYQFLIPINRQNYACKLNNVSKDNCLATDSVVPSKLTIGSRFYPWKRGFSIVAAFDIGVTGVANFIEELAPTPPWTLFIGAGWAVDTVERPPQVVTKVEKVGRPSGGHVHGSVHEKDKQDGIVNAIVAFDNHPEISSLATSADGRFNTEELPDGPYKFAIKADGYKDGACETSLVKAADIQLDCPLEALPRVGTVVGHARDAVSGGPIANATVSVVDATGKDVRVSTDAQGVYRAENMPPGAVTVTVAADNYLTGVETGTVKVRQDNAVDVAVQPKPKNALVQIGAREVNIKQQIQFALDSAVILPESFGLMTEIADALIRNPRLRKIEVQGHTDNSGTPDHNRTLSDQRANAVRDWLTAHGVQPDRLVAKGYGQDRPIVPNVTAAMKARNRRVQFIILEQETPSAVTR
jgi:outer membrane protein OmpA-like peptidoglycan-associated protein